MTRRPLFLALLACVSLEARGQTPNTADRPGPFETITLGVSGQVDLGSGLDDSGYHRLWRPGPSLALRASTPFYIGRAHAGIQFARHDGAGPLPDYFAMLGYGGLGTTLHLPAGLEVDPALLAGILSMDFYGDEDVSLAVRRESELVLGASLDVSAPLTRRLRMGVGVQAVQVYTAPRFRLASATVGLQWRARTPRWLRNLLDS